MQIFIREEMAYLEKQKEQVRHVLENFVEDFGPEDMAQVRRVLHPDDDHTSGCSQFWNFYHGMLWMRFPLAFLAASLLGFAFFAGILTDIYLSIYFNLHHTHHDLHEPDDGSLELLVAGVVLASPAATVAMGMLINQFLCLFFDAMSATPLVHWRATVMVGLLSVGPRNRPTQRTCIIVDATLLLCLELVPLLAMLVSPIGLYPGYLLGLLATAFLLTLLLVAAEVRIAVGTRIEDGDAALVSIKLLREAMETHRMRPSLFSGTGMALMYRAFEVHLTEPEAARRSRSRSRLRMLPLLPTLAMATSRCCCSARRIWRCLWSRGFAWLVLVAVWLSLVVCVILPGILPVKLICVLMSLCIIGFAVVLQGVFSTKRKMGNGYLTVVVVLVLMQLLLLLRGLEPLARPEDNKKPLMRAADPSAPQPEWGDARPYPLCRLAWGGAGARLSALDLAALSQAAYAQSCMGSCDAGRSVECLLNTSFPSGPPRLEFCSDYDLLPRSIVVHFPGGSEGQGTRVVAVKGSSTTTDYMMDIDIYSTIKVLQWIDDSVMPVLSWMPTKMTQWLLNYASLPHFRRPKVRTWSSLTSNVSNLRHFLGPDASDLEDPLVLTGHSLGGALAQVAAMRAGRDALVFSAPGTKYSQELMGVEEQRSMRVVNVVPEDDQVPRVDSHKSVLQRVSCKRRDGSSPSLFRDGRLTLCHSLVKTACELWRSCGDLPQRRNFSKACRKHVDEQYLGRDFPVR